MYRIMSCDYSLDLKKFRLTSFALYLDIFIFTTDHELWTHELMNHILGYDHSLEQKDILKFVYYFMILSLTIYILNNFLLLVPFSHQECNNVFIFILIICI
jgi:hypothetical protein